MPAYNEEANVASTLPRAVADLRSMVGTFEVIVIDDASTDRTGEIVHGLAREHPELSVVRNDRNLRQGGSLKRGFARARFDLVTHNAMDYPFHFDDLPLLLEPARAADVVVGSRAAYPGTSAARRFVSWVNRRLLRSLFGTPVRDFNFVQLYRRSVLDAQPSISDATSFITAEKIIRAHSAGLRVVEVEVPYHPRVEGTPSSANWRNIRRALVDMMRLRRDLSRAGSRTVR
jgi:glycosyltransferase involved in cell wall biosynthesis